MFTGIVETLGYVVSLEKNRKEARLVVEAEFTSGSPKAGDSIAINGVCLTVVKIERKNLFFDMSNSTLEATNLGELSFGHRVNLERALKFDGRLDGHLVTGHIDTTVPIINIKKADFSYRLAIAVPKVFYENIVLRGSITLDGISLTVSDLSKDKCWITIIPFTRDNTNLQFKKDGDSLNLETDIIGKYIQKQIRSKTDLRNSERGNDLTIEKILQSGF